MSDQGETMFEPSGSDLSTQLPPPLYDESIQQEPPPYPQDVIEDGEPKDETTGAEGDMEGDESAPETKSEGQAEDVPLAETSAFEDKTVRRAFVRKVFCILTLQLVFTFSVVCVFTFSTVVRKAVQKNIWIYVSSFIIFVLVSIPLNFAKSLRRKFPWNIIGLAIVTLSLSYVVGAMASYHDTRAVIIAMATTLAVSLTIIAFSAQLLLRVHHSSLLRLFGGPAVLCVPDGRLPVDDGHAELPPRPRGVCDCGTHDLPGHHAHLHLPDEQKLKRTQKPPPPPSHGFQSLVSSFI
ncbi:protein lifeguard 1 isoform X3 [Syngnathoides biaculeatus]|uniref:protein lifeguard 1 isoform X3 n=1 Tax=Syngnathoides biaculeatus TaxID=300417 RepID=UPI002ADDB967|nr:protein lifeguard 1 isoform X3 [Syngnathoides biaculeatus]